MRLAGSEVRSEGMWMRTTFASLAKNWSLQVCRGRTRFQTLSWQDALAEYGGRDGRGPERGVVAVMPEAGKPRAGRGHPRLLRRRHGVLTFFDFDPD